MAGTRLFVGLMSGTSADGVDAALAAIWNEQGTLRLEQRAFLSLPWSSQERALLERLFADQATTQEICRANFDLARGFARAAHALLRAARVSPDQVTAIGSHGQTVWHQVDEEGRVHSTLQIGEPAVIAEETGIPVVADFRVADVAAGGQGAPLVAIFDWLLLRPPQALGGWRAVQNLGGMGNVTFLPPQGVEAPPLAFDTGPGNVLIDWAATRATQGRQSFDQDGRLARQGRIHRALADRWLEHPYFHRPPPKTTGRELFGPELAERWWAQARDQGLSPLDFVATVTWLTAASIADAYARFAPGRIAETVLGGGGSYNPTLRSWIAQALEERLGHPIPVRCHRELDTPRMEDAAKEALAFGLLAYLHWSGRPGNLPECTGARGPRVLGKWVPARGREGPDPGRPTPRS